VSYPDNYKPNIQKYNYRSEPNIWLSTYYVAVKAAGGNFEHMAAYFPLVMGDAPSLWLNNLLGRPVPGLHIQLPRDLQSPGNAFNLERVTMKPNERLRDYTNRFFETRNTCVVVRDDQFVENYKKGVRDHKIFEKIHESGATTVAALMEVSNLIDTDKALVK
jgi:hypothetical protein